MTAFLLGGGPSLKGFDPDILRGRGAVVAINNAYRLAPWADVLFFADRRWLDPEWGHDDIPEIWKGGLIFTRADIQSARHESWPIRILRSNRDVALSRDPGAVAGYCGGGNSINLAFLAGAARIVLLGFDGRNNGNWHRDHRAVTRQEAYPDFIIPSLQKMAAEIAGERGVEVLNATPGSALDMFRSVTLKECLA